MTMTRRDAGPLLLAALERAGIRAGAFDLPVIWPALSAWLRTPIAGVAPTMDWRTFYIAEIPGADPGSGFSPVAPGLEPAGRDLWCVEFDRDLRTRPTDGPVSGRLGLALWYEDDPAWASLPAEDGWIDMGAGTPHVDWSTAFRDDPERFPEELETSPFFRVPYDRRALAFGLTYDGEPDVELTLLAPGLLRP